MLQATYPYYVLLHADFGLNFVIKYTLTVTPILHKGMQHCMCAVVFHNIVCDALQADLGVCLDRQKTTNTTWAAFFVPPDYL